MDGNSAIIDLFSLYFNLLIHRRSYFVYLSSNKVHRGFFRFTKPLFFVSCFVSRQMSLLLISSFFILLLMSRNNNYQATSSTAKDLFSSQQRDIVCTDCGGISATKVQQLLSTLEGTIPLSTNAFSKPLKSRPTYRKKCNLTQKKKNSARNNSQKSSFHRTVKKKAASKPRKLTKKYNRSSLTSRNNNSRIRSKASSKN